MPKIKRTLEQLRKAIILNVKKRRELKARTCNGYFPGALLIQTILVTELEDIEKELKDYGR